MKNRGLLLALVLGITMTVAADPVVTFWIDDGYFLFDNHYERDWWDISESWPYYFSFENEVDSISEGYFTFYCNVDEGYVLFSNTAHYNILGDDVAPRYFSFQSERVNLTLNETWFSFQAKTQTSNPLNLWFLFFVVIVIISVCSLTYVGIQYEKKRRRFL